MIKEARARILPRGRVAKWGKEQLEKLSTLELRALLANAERLQEPEVAGLCNEILDTRPHGHPPARRRERAAEGLRLVTRAKAFQMHGVALRSRIWSRGGVRGDGGVMLTVRADEVQKADGTSSCLLWAPNVGESRPWSDSPAGKERLEHCRIALERGSAEGLLLYRRLEKGVEAKDELSRDDRVDAQTVLKLKVEKRADEYWATWIPERGVVVNHFE